MSLRRLPGPGWLVLIGGGEFSFGETLAADRVWSDLSPEGSVGFLPTASGSADYCRHFADYSGEKLGRHTELIPIYRARDARRQKNVERIAESAVVYLGGGVTDELLDSLSDSPAVEALAQKLASGGIVVAIAAAAQALGQRARSIVRGTTIAGLGWLPGGVVEPNFDPGHDRRLRQLMGETDVSWGLGLPAGSSVLLGPDGETKHVGTSFLLEDADADFVILQ